MSIKDEILILSGTSNEPLAEKVVYNLGIGLGNMQIKRFADGELFVRVEETVRNKDTYIIQPTCHPSNENWMELYCIIDALKRASAKRITAVIPYYGYCRQDRKNEPRVPITAKLVANLLTTAGASRLLTLDLHAAQIQGFFDIPVDHMRAKQVFWEKINELGLIGGDDETVVVSPDVGGVARARDVAKALQLDIAIIDKRRDRANECEVMNIIGDVKGKNGIIIDDIVDTGGTLINATKALKDAGMKKIFIFVNARCVFRNLYENVENSLIDKLYVTDSIKTDENRLGTKIEVLSVASIIASAIKHIHLERSISVMFDN